MKVSISLLTTVCSILILCFQSNSLLVANAFIFEDRFQYCSQSFQDLDDELDLASQLLTLGSEEESLLIFKSIEDKFIELELPAREKLALAIKLSRGFASHKQYEEGAEFTQKYLNLALDSLTRSDVELGEIYECLGVLYLKQKKFDKAILHLNHALVILKSFTDQNSIYYNLGRYHAAKSEFEIAVGHFDTALGNFNLKDDSEENLRLRFMINYHSFVPLLHIGDYSRGFEAIENCEQLSKKIADPLLIYLSNLKYATYYVNMSQPEKALVHLDHPIPSHPAINNYLQSIYYYRAIGNYQLHNYKEAILYFNKSIEICQNSESRGKGFTWLGHAYTQKGDYNLALESYQEALCLYDLNNYASKVSIANTYNFIGRTYKKMKDYATAKINFQTSLKWYGNRTDDKIDANIFLSLVHLESYKEDQNESHVDSILHYMDISDQLIEQMRIEHRFHADQGKVEYTARDLYSENLGILAALHESKKQDQWVNKMFAYIEGIKTYSFKRELREQEGLHSFGIPSGVVEEISQLKKGIKNLVEEIYVLENDEFNSSIDELDQMNQQLDELHREYKDVLKEVEDKHPNYFNYKYNNNTISINTLQESLEPTQAIIEYYVDQKSIYTISIERDTIQFFTKEKPKNWEVVITDYLKSVSDPKYQHEDSTALTFSKFTESSYKIYEHVMKDVVEGLDDNITHLTIIPDEQLNFVQFDNLLMRPAKSKEHYKDLYYLVKHYTSSRAASAYIYNSLKNQPRHHKSYRYLGFAPKYMNGNIAFIDSLESIRKERAEYYNDLVTRGALVDLPAARQSVKTIASLLSGISFIGERATREAFLTKSSEGNIVHFAGHAIVDDQNPEFSQLLFSHSGIDSQLYASDIYDIGLDLDLVVLSACNTGSGKLKHGDGVLSLSRAFMYAGCSSLVMSLWSIPDVQTAQLDNSFFEYIKRGERIDDALRHSKLSFLKNATIKTSHPLYWSGITTSGKMAPIQKPGLWSKVKNLF